MTLSKSPYRKETFADNSLAAAVSMKQLSQAAHRSGSSAPGLHSAAYGKTLPLEVAVFSVDSAAGPSDRFRLPAHVMTASEQSKKQSCMFTNASYVQWPGTQKNRRRIALLAAPAPLDAPPVAGQYRAPQTATSTAYTYTLSACIRRQGDMLINDPLCNE